MFRREGIVAVAENALHKHGVDPASELEAGGAECADHEKAMTAVQGEGGGVGAVADHRDHLPKTEHDAAVDQFGHEGVADIATDEVFGHVDRIFDRVAIARTLAERPGISVTDHALSFGGDQIGQATGLDPLPTGRHFGDRRRLIFKGRRGQAYVVSVNLLNRRHILLGGEPDPDLKR